MALNNKTSLTSKNVSVPTEEGLGGWWGLSSVYKLRHSICGTEGEEVTPTQALQVSFSELTQDKGQDDE